MGIKVNIEFSEPLNGWLNLTTDPQKLNLENLPEDTQIGIGNLKGLNNYLSDNSCEILIVNSPLNILLPNEVIDTLQVLQNKLQQGGKCLLTILDIKRIARAIYTSEIPIEQADILLFGSSREFNSLMEVTILKNVLESLDFHIETISIKDFYGSFEVSKK